MREIDLKELEADLTSVRPHLETHGLEPTTIMQAAQVFLTLARRESVSRDELVLYINQELKEFNSNIRRETFGEYLVYKMLATPKYLNVKE